MKNENLKYSTIGILGTGWLGLPLAKRLLALNCRVKGSTTSAEKLPGLTAEGIEAFQIAVEPEGIAGDVTGFLKDVELLIVDIPPGLRKDPKRRFSEGIRMLASEIEKAGIEKVIFVSSIAVYEETETFPIYTEDTAPNAGAAAGKELAASEEILLQNPFFETTVLRFGGLIGGERHPVKYLAGRENLSNPMGPVNLIHREDCIGIILKLLQKGVFDTVFNAVYPLNPPKEKYYQQKAAGMGLKIPFFDHSKPSKGKIISASKVMRELEYEFSTMIN